MLTSIGIVNWHQNLIMTLILTNSRLKARKAGILKYTDI